MDPLTVIGGAAASSQLLAQAVKSADTAYKTYRSFRDAPKELEQVAQKLATAKDRIKQIQAFGNELSNSDMNDLFPKAHRTLLLATLGRSMGALGRLRSLKDTANPQSLRIKASWAALDKRQVGRIMEDLSGTERILDQALAIFNARLGTLSRTSLGALRVGQLAIEATGTKLETSMDAMQHTAANATAYAKESTTLMRSNTALLQQSLDEQRANRQQLESMLATQQQLLLSMQKIQASMSPLPHVVSSSCGTKPTASGDRPRRAQEMPSRMSLVSSTTCFSSLDRYQSRDTEVIEWRAGEYIIDGWSTPFTHHKPRISQQQAGRPFATKLHLSRKKKGKRTDIQARASLSLFGAIILQAELRIRVVATAWFIIPSFWAGITTINVRPGDAPIFEAIEDMDIARVKGLLDSGEASIHDIMDGTGQTLLAIASYEFPVDSEPDLEWKRKREGTVGKMIALLLREGCDPNVRVHAVNATMSLMGWSLTTTRSSIAQMLFDHGADPDWFPVHHCMSWASPELLLTELRLIHSWGVLDSWSREECIERSYVLYGYCQLGDTELVIPHLEDGGLNVNRTGMLDPPLHEALRNDNLELAAVFLDYGANIDHNNLEGDDKPRDSALRYVLLHASTLCGAHLLLSYGANLDNTGGELLESVFRSKGIMEKRFSFDEVVGVAAHVLFHNSDLPASEQVGEETCSQAICAANIELNEACRQGTSWTTKAFICLDEYGDDNDNFPGEVPTDAESAYDGRMIEHEIFAQNEKDTSPSSFRAMAHSANCRDEFACNGKTGFEELVSTREGRRRLARYPVTTAYWTAVNLAGYRAEMDDDGNVWWDDDDCDQYVEAREYQPPYDKEDGVLENCPMCRDPEKWGLDIIRSRKEAGLMAIDDYRSRKAAKVMWPTTYGTRF